MECPKPERWTLDELAWFCVQQDNSLTGARRILGETKVDGDCTLCQDVLSADLWKGARYAPVAYFVCIHYGQIVTPSTSRRREAIVDEVAIVNSDLGP